MTQEIATVPTPDAGSSSSRFPFQFPRPSRSFWKLAGIGAAVYAITLMATIPAGLILHSARGTVWSGTAPLAAGHRIAWTWSPVQSLAHLGFGANWRIEGGDTDLSGTAILYPAGVRLKAITGVADAALLFANLPDLPFACQFLGKVDISGAFVGGDRPWIDGTMTNGAGTCRARAEAGRDMAVPPSILQAERAQDGGSAISIVPQDRRGSPLLHGALTIDGHLRYTLTPEGARLLPFAVAPGGVDEAVDMAL